MTLIQMLRKKKTMKILFNSFMKKLVMCYNQVKGESQEQT